MRGWVKEDTCNGRGGKENLRSDAEDGEVDEGVAFARVRTQGAHEVGDE